jgi:hypothetical protein
MILAGPLWIFCWPKTVQVDIWLNPDRQNSCLMDGRSPDASGSADQSARMCKQPNSVKTAITLFKFRQNCETAEGLTNVDHQHSSSGAALGCDFCCASQA